MQAFEKAALAEFERRMLGYVADGFARQTSLLGPAQMRRVIALGRERAERRGHKTEREIYLYLTLMLMLGSWFDEDPQLVWAAEMLDDRSIRHAPARLNRVHGAAMDYLDAVAGENNEHLIKALVRIRDFDPASTATIPADRFEDEMVRTLSRFHPQKADRQGEEATRTIVRQAGALARRHSLAGQSAVCLLAGLAFMLGAGFHRDPQFPWAQESLERGDAARLHKHALAYLDAGLQ
jgi:hypothetical protein